MSSDSILNTFTGSRTCKSRQHLLNISLPITAGCGKRCHQLFICFSSLINTPARHLHHHADCHLKKLWCLVHSKAFILMVYFNDALPDAVFDFCSSNWPALAMFDEENPAVHIMRIFGQLGLGRWDPIRVDGHDPPSPSSSPPSSSPSNSALLDSLLQHYPPSLPKFIPHMASLSLTPFGSQNGSEQRTVVNQNWKS